MAGLHIKVQDSVGLTQVLGLIRQGWHPLASRGVPREVAPGRVSVRKLSARERLFRILGFRILGFGILGLRISTEMGRVRAPSGGASTSIAPSGASAAAVSAAGAPPPPAPSSFFRRNWKMALNWGAHRPRR